MVKKQMCMEFWLEKFLVSEHLEDEMREYYANWTYYIVGTNEYKE